MGQIKNIKLHIVTDIKLDPTDLLAKEEKMAFRSRQLVQSLVRLGSLHTRSGGIRVTSSKLSCMTKYSSQFQPVICNIRLPQRSFATEPTLEDIALELFKTVDKVDAEKLTMDAHLTETLGLDSLDITDIIMAFEERFNVVIADEEVQNLQTVGQCIDLVKQKLEGQD